MSSANNRSREEIRAQIRAERAQLRAAAAGLGEDAKRTARLAGTAFGALTFLRLLVRLRRRRAD